MEQTTRIGKNLRRLPGQALSNRQADIFDDRIVPMLCVIQALAIITMIESLHLWMHLQPMPFIFLLMTVGAVIWFVICFGRTRRELANMRRGEEGERIVAQAIEDSLIPLGYFAFHDIQLENDGRQYNIDHLVIGRNGVFAIETKNYKKPAKGQPRVDYDGKRVLWNGKRLRDEAGQALAAAKSAKRFISQQTGIDVFVKPVLCAVGWYASSTDLYGHPVLLVMEKTLGSVFPRVKNGSTLDAATIQTIRNRLSRVA